MPRSAVIDAVEGRLADEWTHCPVVGMNERDNFEPPSDASAYLVVQYPLAGTERQEIDADTAYWEAGAFRFVLHNEGGAGLGTVRAWHDELSDLFRYQSFDGMECGEVTPGGIGDSNDRGNYFVSTLVVQYIYKE